jgi:hypothetical protein
MRIHADPDPQHSKQFSFLLSLRFFKVTVRYDTKEVQRMEGGGAFLRAGVSERKQRKLKATVINLIRFWDL